MRSEELDELFRNEINGLDGLPQNVSWSKEAGWKKLNAQLIDPEGRKGIFPLWPAKKVIASYWIYASAAIITLMLVSVYTMKSYWIVPGKQSETGALATVHDTGQANPDHRQKSQAILEKSILTSENLSKMGVDKSKNDVTPFLITDPHLKSQLLTYNNSMHQGRAGNPRLLPTFLARISDHQPNTQMLLPLPVNGLAQPGFAPPVASVTRNGFQGNLTDIDATKGTGKNIPLAFILGGNLAAVDRGLNFGMEGGVMLKLPGLKGKHDNMIGIGMDTRYQFYSPSESDHSLDDLGGAEKSEIKNGFNTFVTASYSRNLSKKEKKPFWVGMKVGYLVQDNTNSFDDTTLMLEMIVGGNDSSKFKVSPQIYLTNNLKKVMPGIKLGMALGKFEKDVSI